MLLQKYWGALKQAHHHHENAFQLIKVHIKCRISKIVDWSEIQCSIYVYSVHELIEKGSHIIILVTGHIYLCSHCIHFRRGTLLFWIVPHSLIVIIRCCMENGLWYMVEITICIRLKRNQKHPWPSLKTEALSSDVRSRERHHSRWNKTIRAGRRRKCMQTVQTGHERESTLTQWGTPQQEKLQGRRPQQDCKGKHHSKRNNKDGDRSKEKYEGEDHSRKIVWKKIAARKTLSPHGSQNNRCQGLSYHSKWMSSPGNSLVESKSQANHFSRRMRAFTRVKISTAFPTTQKKSQVPTPRSAVFSQDS